MVKKNSAALREIPLTPSSQKHRDWIYGYKGPSQFARTANLLRDGNSDWFDVSPITAAPQPSNS